ncbi:MAG TPA: M48 family metallopeptidase [Burkholderiales bacterium]|nr:M48 family metallopeptidase [Burkholderiales bacterium]
MNFFEHQQVARRNSRRMVVLFLLATAAVVAAVVAVIAGLYAASLPSVQGGVHVPLQARLGQVPPSVYLWAALATAGLVFAVSAINVARLGGGGAAVARMVGAREVSPQTRDPLERRFLNVVEEMAIASGVRVPGTWVMDGESGINAFAAGWDVSGAVVAVTRGALERLTREELQGVVAHEFSHILNGDMRLNVRMLGVLAGIVFIGAIGEFVMRSARGTRDKGAYFWVAGLAIFVVGYVGLFFARLIKAAVAREREFLADASSVQFTRNPEGIAGALDQIRLAAGGALIGGRYAEDLSHMFFGQSVRVRFAGIFDTHPPLDERIRRVHARFDAASYRQTRPARTASEPKGRRQGDVGIAWGRTAAQSALLVGTLDAGKIDYAAQLLGSLPAGLREALQAPEGAAAAVIALLLAPEERAREQQLEGAGELAARARELEAHTRPLGPAYRLPVIDLALPVLRAAPESARQALLAALEAVVNADRRVALHEFVVLALLRSQFAAKGGPAPAGRRLADLHEEAALVLRLLVHAGRRADAEGERHEVLERALAAGAKEMGLRIAARPAITFPAVELALSRLGELAPLEKATLIRGLFAAATADGEIRIGEAELLRLAGAVVGCPLPPLVVTEK